MVEKEPEYKKRCRKCKYHVKLSVPGYGPYTACDYLEKRNELRGCPASECDKFESRRKKRK